MGLFDIFKRKKEDTIKVGDMVKCIDDRDWNNNAQSMSLEYGKKYKVLAIVKCPTCNSTSFDIGCRFNDNKTHTLCNGKTSGVVHSLPFQGAHLAGIFRFEKTIGGAIEERQSKEEIEKKINIAVKEEDYELAQELTKQLTK